MAKKRRKWQRGKFSERREPIWEPLLEALPEDIEDFMWMGEGALTDGTQIQFYKHYWTRRYLLLDLGGRTWIQLADDRYEEAEDPAGELEVVFGFRETRGDIVRRNEWAESDRPDYCCPARRSRHGARRASNAPSRSGVSSRSEMAKVKKQGTAKEGEWATLPPGVEERLSKECEEGFDLSTWTTVRVGRPPLDGVRVSERITIRVPPDLYDAAKAKAAKEKRSISNLTREALQRYVED